MEKSLKDAKSSHNTLTANGGVVLIPMPSKKISTTGSREAKRRYWAIWQNREVIYEGTYSECWHHFTGKYCNNTVRELVEKNIRIARNG